MSPRFDPHSVRSFRFVSYCFDPERAVVRLEYAFDDDHRFVEELTFPGADLPLDEARAAALDRCLRHLHLAAGVSYFKAAVPPRLGIEWGEISSATAGFFDRLYRRGLAEFLYRNGLELAPEPLFEGGPGLGSAPARLPLARRTALPLGGGKDSLVALEALRAMGETPLLVTVGDFPAIAAVAAATGLPHLVIQRRLAPELLALNELGAHNGHVPISAVLAFVLAAAAVLYDFDAVAMANERSAEAPELVWRGRPVNHEYSKSLEFEDHAQRLLASEILPGLSYFSLLRPLSELSIAGLFARLERYHPVFRSCNRAFRQRAAQRPEGWCGDCPKCRFVFLSLAPFLGRERTVAIFGRDLLAEPAQRAGYEELLGLASHPPFECVGEVDESVAALCLVAEGEWRGVDWLAVLAGRFAEGREERLRRVLTPSTEHRVPPALAPALGELEAGALADRDRLVAARSAAGG